MLEAERVAERPEDLGVDPDKLAALFTRAAREVEEGLLPSVQIAVARRGRIVGQRTFGNASRQGRVSPADDDTLYCIFSCTKAITSAAAWILIQEGKLDPAERVADAIPEFGTNGKDGITVEQLFTHTAGFPTAPFRPAEFLDRERRLERFGQWRLNWEPGSQFQYHPSSSMYVIAELIERRSGLAYGDFVRRRVAEPLGLHDLWCGLPESEQPRMADLQNVGEALTAEDFERFGFPMPPETEVTEEAIEGFNDPAVRRAGIPGGGGTTTAANLALFYQGLLGDLAGDGPGVWQADMVREGLRERTGDLLDPMFGKPARRTLGLVMAGEDGVYRGFGRTCSPRAFGHGGAGGQIGWADPETGLSIGYCTNGLDRNPVRMGRRIVGISSRAATLLAD